MVKTLRRLATAGMAIVFAATLGTGCSRDGRDMQPPGTQERPAAGAAAPTTAAR